MDQQQQELRQAAAQAFMESLDLLEECLHTAEPTPESTSESIESIAPSPTAATTEPRTPSSSIDRPDSTSHFTSSRGADLTEPSSDTGSKINPPRHRAIDSQIDWQALEEAVADIEQFMNCADSE